MLDYLLLQLHVLVQLLRGRRCANTQILAEQILKSPDRFQKKKKKGKEMIAALRKALTSF